jgi:hypothetical protein
MPPEGRDAFSRLAGIPQIAIRNATSLGKKILKSRKNWVKGFIGSHAGAWEPGISWFLSVPMLERGNQGFMLKA